MILLDTCVLLWLAIDQSKLSTRTSQRIRESAGAIFVSSITAFEIGQKHARGRLRLKMEPGHWFPRALELHGLREIALRSEIALAATALPDLHRDPFDRILVATAQTRNLTLLTPDPLIQQYPDLGTLW